MGKKNQNNAEELLNELKGEEESAQGPAESKPGQAQTSTKSRPTKTKTAVSTRKKANYDDIDPDLRAVLSLPDDEPTPPPVSKDPKPPQKEKASSQPPQAPQKSQAKGDSMKTVESPPQAPGPSEASRGDLDKTQKIQVPKASSSEPSLKLVPEAASPSSGGSLEEQLKSANYLELAQNRVLELEKEVQKLRRANEQLASAGQHFKGLTDSIKQQLRQSEANFTNFKEISEEEKKILTQSLEAKEIKINVLQDRLVELEEKINSSFDHVRIRERELENRIEIMKSESDAVTSTKDEMILDLKKQVSLMNSDLEKYRIQNQKTVAKLESKEELLRRTVKALRIALTMLEGSHSDDD